MLVNIQNLLRFFEMFDINVEHFCDLNLAFFSQLNSPSVGRGREFG